MLDKNRNRESLFVFVKNTAHTARVIARIFFSLLLSYRKGRRSNLTMTPNAGCTTPHALC